MCVQLLALTCVCVFGARYTRYIRYTHTHIRYTHTRTHAQAHQKRQLKLNSEAKATDRKKKL